MVVYVELAFLENFCLDLLLLLLTVYAAKAKPPVWRVLFSACFGGVFALLFPLLSLPTLLGWALKLSVGGVLPLLALGKRKWGIGSLFFFLFAFGFGGALLGVGGELPPLVRFPLFLSLAVFSAVLVGKLYKRRARFQYIYECTVGIGEKTATARGFWDSGNFATKGGLPVCFLSAALLGKLWGEKMDTEGQGGGQGCVEMQIFTQAGARILRLYRGQVRVEGEKATYDKEVYFALGRNRIGREYDLILHSRIFE